MSIGMEGCGPNPRTYSKDEYAALEAECERLREETAVLLGDIAELEVRRDAALAELAALVEALRRIRDRAEAFATDDMDMPPHSSEMILEISSRALAAYEDKP